MKKFLTLLWLTLTAFAFKAEAQGTTCNAEFAVQYVTNFTVKFNPATANDSPYVHHYWSFGDGSTGSQYISPTHTYAAPGTYAVVHTIVRVNQNNIPVCTQSFTKQVIITEPCNLVADFSWSTTGSNPLVVAFQNLSVPLAATDSITWQFGDNTSSHAVNPVHTYANAGTYNVCLIVKKNNNSNPVCIKYICKTVVVTAPCTLVADFNWTVAATNSLTFEFHNLSTPLAITDSIKWTFGDGSTSNQVNPVHTYANAGTYTVCLRIIKYLPGSTAPCIREICKTVVVTIPCTLVVDFSWTSAAANPFVVIFHNLSVPLASNDSITWQFGDNTSSHDVNPVHTYANAGTYNVCLIVKKNNNSIPVCIKYTCKTIIVTPPCTLVADFNWTVAATNPLTFEFHNLSTPLAITDSIKWTFGDGSSSNQVNPVHTYANAGTYTVCLRIIKYLPGSNTPCVREICKTIVVTQPCTLVADFNWTVTATNPLRIEFHNLSTPLAANDSIRWTFGDGTTSNQVNPVHTYTAPGTYTVCLRIIKYLPGSTIPCVREICKTIVVTQPCNLVVDFNWTATATNPLRFEFHNLSTPLAASDSCIWSFGDGTTSYDVNPIHTYANAGTYTVCLVVKKFPFNIGTACVRYTCKTIVVTPPCNFNVNFSWRLDSLNHKKVYFTNLTNPPTAGAIAVWNFGDGTSATSWNAVHEYAQPGTYRVCLRVYLGSTSNCVREFCDTIFVPVPPPACTQLSNYHFEKFSNDNQKYTFTADYINTNLVYTWTFGDGTGSHDPIAIHRYAQAGNYTACLTVWRGPDCASTTCKTITVQAQINCDSAHVSYSYQRDPQVTNKIYFYAGGSLPILDQTWTITRMGGATTPPVILHQNNPAYLFQDTGYYRVCLRAVMLGGCIKEYCNYIYIEHVSNACVLQAYPNPATAVVNVNVYLTQAEMINASVYNSLNVLVLTKQQQGFTGNNVVSLNVGGLTAGQYTIRLVYGGHVCYASFQKL
ncbi:MAG: PKD domain-containing protein [Ferruginibacter sp.]